MPRNESPCAHGHVSATALPGGGTPNASAVEALLARVMANATRAADLAAVSAAETHRRSARAHESAVGIHQRIAAMAEARGDPGSARRHRETAETERRAAGLAYHSVRAARRRANTAGLP